MTSQPPRVFPIAGQLRASEINKPFNILSKKLNHLKITKISLCSAGGLPQIALK
jgi:hypothetical protein